MYTDHIYYEIFQSIPDLPVNTTVYKVTASDPDINSILRYYMYPKQGINGIGDTADPNIYNVSIE